MQRPALWYNRPMATMKQRRTLETLLEHPEYSTGRAMRENGYSPSVAHVPAKLTESTGFKELLAEIDERPIIENVRAIALGHKDKRAALTAADMLFKLLDRYPAGKLKIQAYNEELERLKSMDHISPAI